MTETTNMNNAQAKFIKTLFVATITLYASRVVNMRMTNVTKY